MICSINFWTVAFNTVLNGIAVYLLIWVFVDIRRIEIRFEGLLKLTGN